MTRRATIASRLLAIAAALTLVLGVGAGVSSLTGTQAAWNDKTFTSAAVSAGDWAAPSSNGCVVMNFDGTPKKDGYCSIAAFTYTEWTSNGAQQRNYYVTPKSNVSNGYIVFTLDLSKATKEWSFATAPFNWSTAATLSGNITPTSACASLPLVTAKSGTLWSDWSLYLTVTDNVKSSWTPASCS